MDPNETRRLLRERLDRIAAGDSSDDDALLDDLYAVAEYADTLDRWIGGGGFLPDVYVRN